MSIIATLAAAATIAACSWDNPGHNPFTGEVPAAVERYKDIPKATRDKLRLRMAKRLYDDLAVITRDEIRGKSEDYGLLRDMHFGAGQVCGTVTRERWRPQHTERGLVYCEDGHCLIVPTVCRNVSRITPLRRPRLSELVPPVEGDIEGGGLGAVPGPGLPESFAWGVDLPPVPVAVPHASPPSPAPLDVPSEGGAMGPPAGAPSMMMFGGSFSFAAFPGGGGAVLVPVLYSPGKGGPDGLPVDLPGGGSPGLDGVPVTPVPEASTLAQWGISLVAGVGYAYFRRRRVGPPNTRSITGKYRSTQWVMRLR